MQQFGLFYDEGPDKKGKYGPYLQSARLPLYQTAVTKLLAAGAAYHCFCSATDLQTRKEEQMKNKLPPKYDRRCLNLTPTEIEQKLSAREKYVIRLKVPAGQTKFTDLVRGEVVVKNEIIDDQVLMKSDGYPTYHLAVVADDHLMKISHIIRGEEWIPSTPKHVLIYQALDWPLPQFVHLPLLLNPDKSKLSKRQGDVTVDDYLQKGYLPSALLNFIALLGWNPGDDQEIFSLRELVKKFNLAKVQKGGAIFDLAKLKWMNSQYIKNSDSKELIKLSLDYLKKINNFSASKYNLEKVVELFKERLDNLEELAAQAAFIYDLKDYQASLLIPSKSDQATTKLALRKAKELIQNLNQGWQANTLRKYFDLNREAIGLSRSNLFWPIRLAVSGQKNSPDLFAIMEILEQAETSRRIDLAIEKINNL